MSGVDASERAQRPSAPRKARGNTVQWTGAEVGKLRRMWGLRPRAEIEAAIPRHNWRGIASKANRLGLFRQRHVRMPLGKSENPLLEQVRARMQAKGFTATDLQECAGIKRGTVSLWFKPGAQPRLPAMERIVEALGGQIVIVWE